MYWSGVPLGQKPPPPTGEPENATQTCPMLSMPHAMRLAWSRSPEVAKRLSARGRPGLGAGFAAATEASPRAASESSALVRTKRFHRVELMITPYKSASQRLSGGAGWIRRHRPKRLEFEFEPDPDLAPRRVEAPPAEERILERVQRPLLLRQRVLLVAVAEARFRPLQRHAAELAAPRPAARQIDWLVGAEHSRR